MSGFTTTTIEIDLYDAIIGMSAEGVLNLVDELLKDGYIPDGWTSEPEGPDMTNPIDRIAAIDWLRKNGWTVEPCES